ncbi:MAG: endonuclease MutS2 [Thermomicrobiales bacterium]|nr:endonuclease MutS2 [Thermomicrobiales bacterium]
MITDHTLGKLEFGRILEMLARECRYSVATEMAGGIRPTSNPQLVETLLATTSEASELLVQFPAFSIGGARDIRDLITKSTKGFRIQPAELLTLIDTLRASRDLRNHFRKLPDAHERYPHLQEFAESIENFSTLEADLNRTIGPRGDVLDSASPALGRIRQAVRIAHSRLHDRLQSFLSGSRHSSALQENIITMRDGRYVIPVRADARSLIKGIVHDTSASGQTLFIEPFDVVELNNRWREQQLEEQREVDRILDVISGKVGDSADGLLRMVMALAQIDLAVAKARLATKMEATRPAVHRGNKGERVRDTDARHPTQYIRLDRARHPLLDQRKVVPTDIEIGDKFRVLLITGPNTGGKTVALKTVGLLTVMAQSGLFIPADDRSVISVFADIYVDIGDEQSIEQSLSTFSSHITNIIGMLENVHSDSLVLLDEVGAGTDPQEGSALARAIIGDLLSKRAMVIATTHYSEVKAYAYATRGVENASVEFDLASLRPTYRLMIGVPGKSNALSIAARLGMPKRVVDAASAMLDPDDEDAQQLIDDIRTRRDDISTELAKAKQADDDARELRRRAARVLREAEEIKRQARAEAIAEVEAELSDAREAAREINRIKRSGIGELPDRVETARQIRAAQEQVREVQKRKATPKPQVQIDKAPIRPGDRVRVLAFDELGDVVSIDAESAEVLMGSMKVRQPLASLERIGKAKQSEQKTQTSASIARERVAAMGTMPLELDIRGKRVDEIPPIVDSYVNDAYLMGMPMVSIIHGKGTGALRTVVRDLLKGNPAVSRAETARPNEGGDGATVVHLRQT